MNAAYIDTSVLVAIAFGEPGWQAHFERLAGFDLAVSSTLLESELASTFAREGLSDPWSAFVTGITWIHPDRSLSPELERVFRVGYCRGADAHHLATALFLGERPSAISFMTLDSRQLEIAKALGFTVD